MMRVFTTLCAGVGLWLAVCSSASAATEIALHERVVASSPVVKLGDVAEIETADRAVGRRLAARLLMPAPAPGTQRFLRQREIQDLLANYGEDLGQLRFVGAAQVAILSPEAEPAAAVETMVDGVPDRGFDRQALLLAGKITRPNEKRQESASQCQLDEQIAEELREQFRQTIINHLTEKDGKAGAWRVKCDIADRHLAQLQIATAAPKCYGGGAPWTGKQRFLISFPTVGGMVQAPVYADVALAKQVVVAIEPIERGATITAADVELQAVDYTPTGSDRHIAVEAVETIIGMEARQAIQAGEIVYIDQLQQPLMVKRGDLIAVVSQGGGIKVRTTARARKDGVLGDLVQVETLDTKEPFDVRVTGSREAEVFAGVAPAISKPRAPRSDTARRQ